MNIHGKDVKEVLHIDADCYPEDMDDLDYLHEVADYIGQLEESLAEAEWRLESLED